MAADLRRLHATVSGLDGAGLVLQVNGASDVAVSANGRVTLASLAVGAEYVVTVRSRPENPAQSCSVANGKGTIGHVEVNDVLVTCRALGEAEIIGTGLGYVAQQVAMDPAGNVTVLWVQSDGRRQSIWSRQYAVATGWATAEIVETDGSGEIQAPQVAIGSNSDAVAVWVQSDGTRKNVLASRYVAGNGWGRAELIETDHAGDGEFPRVGMDPAGNAIAVWRQSDGVFPRIWANRYTVGIGWGTAERIEIDPAGSAGMAELAIGPNGDAIANWVVRGETHSTLWTRRYVAGTGWGKVEALDTELIPADQATYDVNRDGLGSHSVAMNAAGNAIAVWRAGGELRSSQVETGKDWSEARSFGCSSDSQVPQVVMDEAGNALVVWHGGEGNRAWANRRVAGIGWGTAQQIGIGDGVEVSPRVAMDSSGNAIAVWRETTGPTEQEPSSVRVCANRYHVGDGWEEPRRSSCTAGADALWFGGPSVVMDPSGNAIAVWSQRDGTHSNIWARPY